jgi:Outer membrane protein beta-barrel domain
LNGGIRLALLVGLLPARAAGQGFFDEFSYEGLKLSAVSFELGTVVSDRLDQTISGAIRVDAGMIAPRVRVLVGLAYYKSDFKSSEIDKFEQNILDLIDDPTGDATIAVGSISWASLQGDLDLQYLFPLGSSVMAYGGLGLGLYLRNGSGPAIEGTFIEGALDTVAAGAAASAGLEVALSRRVSLTGDARGMLTGELLSAAFRAGIQYRFRPWSTQ